MRPPRQLIALTDEVQDSLTSWCIATPGIDQPEIQEGLIDDDGTTNDDAHAEDVRELDPDASNHASSDKNFENQKLIWPQRQAIEDRNVYQRRDMAPPNEKRNIPDGYPSRHGSR